MKTSSLLNILQNLVKIGQAPKLTVEYGSGTETPEETDYYNSIEYLRQVIPQAIQGESEKLAQSAQKFLDLLDNYGPDILGSGKQEVQYVVQEFIKALQMTVADLSQKSQAELGSGG